MSAKHKMMDSFLFGTHAEPLSVLLSKVLNLTCCKKYTVHSRLTTRQCGVKYSVDYNLDIITIETEMGGHFLGNRYSICSTLS